MEPTSHYYCRVARPLGSSLAAMGLVAMTLLVMAAPIKGALTQEPAQDEGKYSVAGPKDPGGGGVFLFFKKANCQREKREGSSMVGYSRPVIPGLGRKGEKKK